MLLALVLKDNQICFWNDDSDELILEKDLCYNKTLKKKNGNRRPLCKAVFSPTFPM